MNTCTCCFEDYLVQCGDTIRINTKLTPLGTYLWVITDKFDRQYSGNIVADGDGLLLIPVADLPAGLLTQHSGEFTLQLYSTDDECHPISFMMAKKYDCISFEIKGGDRVKNNIGCQF